MNDRDFKVIMRLRSALRHAGKLLITVNPQALANFNITLIGLFEDIDRLDKLLADHFELSGQSGGGGD